MLEQNFHLIGPNPQAKHRHLLRQCDGLQNQLYGNNIQQTGRDLIHRVSRKDKQRTAFHFVLADDEHKVLSFASFSTTDSSDFREFWRMGALTQSAWAGPRSVEIVALCFDAAKFRTENGADDAILRAKVVEDMMIRGYPQLHALGLNKLLVACARGDSFIFSRLDFPRKQLVLPEPRSNVFYYGFRISETDFSQHFPKWQQPKPH